MPRILCRVSCEQYESSTRDQPADADQPSQVDSSARTSVIIGIHYLLHTFRTSRWRGRVTLGTSLRMTHRTGVSIIICVDGTKYNVLHRCAGLLTSAEAAGVSRARSSGGASVREALAC